MWVAAPKDLPKSPAIFFCWYSLSFWASSGISLGVLYVPEWPTQTCWLTCDKSWLRNGMPSHSSVWPGWWPAWGGAKLLWLRMDLPHATEVPDSVKWIKCKTGQCVLFFLITMWECNHPIHPWCSRWWQFFSVTLVFIFLRSQKMNEWSTCSTSSFLVTYAHHKRNISLF